MSGVGQGLGRRAFLRAAASAPVAALTVPGVRPHLALYVYTRPIVRPRHARVVRDAIARRAEALESGWRIERRRPVLELGPVRGAAHWRGTRIVKPVPAAWPFAVVLELTPEKGASAWIDWFRRGRGSRDGAGWFLDPAGTYVEHMNAATVCGRDDRFAYMAVVDTPTGGVMGSNEFAVRGRVTWANGASSRKGWWIRFRTPRTARPEDWVEELTPLVRWRLGPRDRRRGFLSSRLLTAGDRLAVWGRRTVFRFPDVPAGVHPCRP